VLGLIEALDADSADLPALLDMALTGSLWSRQIARLGAEAKRHQLWIMEARARLIWNKSTAAQRRGQFAMGVSLESGLALDAVASELTDRLDDADNAATAGDASTLAAALVAMAERLYTIRPFVPEADLPDDWRDLLAAWLYGTDVTEIGLDNMRVIEDAFIYRLTWAIEAIRMRRRAEGGASDFVEGSAAACLEAGLPQSMMAMLVRAGLPSRIAARVAIEQTGPSFATLSEMSDWLSSEEIETLSADQSWPTPATAAIWRRFRQDVLAAPVQRWIEQEWNLESKLPDWASPDYPARVYIDEPSDEVTITSPDYRTITTIQQALFEPRPSLLRVDYSPDRKSAVVNRIGRGSALWHDL
jgi:hypothetical protein